MRKLKRTIALFSSVVIVGVVAIVAYIGFFKDSSNVMEEEMEISPVTKHLLTRLKIHFAFDNSFYGTKQSVD